MLTDQEKAKIRQEAEALYPLPKDDNKFLAKSFVKAQQEVHIDAVIAERERADKTIEGLRKEAVAAMLIHTKDGDYKKGYNDALQKMVRFINQYKNGEGLFQ